MMNDGFAFFDIIVFAMLAGYLVFQLRRTLGRKTGHQKPQGNNPTKPKTSNPDNDNVVSLPDTTSQPADAASEVDGLTKLKQSDPTFNDQEFIAGSKEAFSWIVSAYSSGDTAKLEGLLGDSLFSRFEQAIRQRKQANLSLETNIVSIKSAQINDVQINGAAANITVEFVSDQIKVVRDAEGNEVEGNPDVIETLTDLWTFNREIKSSNPNWLLVRTDTPQETN
tara:strand:+ start:5410 stop:6081 length:672 start_codon:yes stop_codon:yes gene_type:complete